MNPEKFTHKTNEAFVACQDLALTSEHAQFTLVHLASVLVSDPTSIFRQSIISAASGEDSSALSFEHVVTTTLNRLPSQHPPPENIPPSSSLQKLVCRAQTSQKARGDTHLAIDQLILALLEDSQVADCLKEAGIFRQSIIFATSGEDSSALSFEHVVTTTLNRLPSQHPPPENIPPSSSLQKLAAVPRPPRRPAATPT